jgi:hypothetical protein
VVSYVYIAIINQSIALSPIFYVIALPHKLLIEVHHRWIFVLDPPYLGRAVATIDSST